MKTRVRTLALILAAVFSLASCGHAGVNESSDGASSSVVKTVAADTRDCYKGMTAMDKTGILTITKNGLTCTFDSDSGLLKSVSNDKMTLELSGVIIDTGYDNVNLLNQTSFSSLRSLNTWDLPRVVPKNKGLPEGYKINGIYEDDGCVKIEVQYDNVIWVITYDFIPSALKISAEIFSLRHADTVINGVSFSCKDIKLVREDVAFDFPGNTPAHTFMLSELSPFLSISADYCNPVVSFRQKGANFNILFIDQDEKWGTAVFKNKDGDACVTNVAGVEAMVKGGEKIYCGDMFIQLTGADEPYDAVSGLYAENGWTAPENGLSEGPVYSCHPYGTMDSGFSKLQTLNEFAAYTEVLNYIGIKNIWLLPIFKHPGAEVYAADDQSVIDPRYGGAEGARAFTAAANALGMHVMFDYVPHGPQPWLPLAKNNPDWCSKTIDGKNQIEWECVSFDYNNPDYLKYTHDLVFSQATEIGIEGARIDCAMGGLSNWSPVAGNRASNSGLKAGVAITKCIRQGFIDAGKMPIVLPENFHPVPFYAPYTDMFYDMPLYRTIHELRARNADDTRFATVLSRWLSVEHKTSPKGQVKLRFLDNHDTVSWTWDKARPTEIYGVDKAKALWALLGLIDGVPMIYQGDEDPSWYNKKGENLTDFFKDLYAAREKYLGNDYNIEYHLNDSPVIAFTRTNGKSKRMVLVSLSKTKQSFDIGAGKNTPLYANGVKISKTTATLNPYGFIIIDK